ncbi:FAD-dependent oxidoreductase [Intrasporangium sp.]|uniref:FAD-dependent oxidoreductase n=1 Tax=Intrasporangium sp. TaxID=1925024 RepID=UPI00336587C4
MAGRRVVILGGGMAGLTTAWELSSGDWRKEFDSITVYQRGWRLGGKGASSRGPHGRIEEHGLHVLLGYYDATFRLLREVYAELDRTVTDPGCPIRDWREAFSPSDDVGLADHDGTTWSHFVTQFSRNGDLPGEPGAEDRPLEPLGVALRALRLLADFDEAVAPEPAGAGVYLSASAVPRPAGSAIRTLVRAGSRTTMAGLLVLLDRAAGVVTGPGLGAPVVDAVTAGLQRWRDDLRAAVQDTPAARRTWQLVDLVATNLQGMVVDGLLSGTAYERIDHLDYREWLALHGAARETRDSPIVRGMYDLTFAYEGGDRSRPRFAAGLGLQLASRMLFDYKGSIFWRMQAGMGEVVFAPLYQALVQRGVEFTFFRRLSRLSLADDRSIRSIRSIGSIGSIELVRQAEPAIGQHAYDPLVRHGGLPCWPDRPLVNQLDHDPGVHAESHWARDDGRPVETLRAGEDFDVAVLAVSLGMIPHVAGELLAADPAWRRMVDHVATVGTRAAQLWFRSTEAQLGWNGRPGVTLTGFGNTFDTWASMSHLLSREGWPEHDGPRALAYLCGAMPDGDPASAGRRVRGELTRFLDEESGALWPAVSGPQGFRWEALWDDRDRIGPERLDAQYLRANLDPSDRYVQSLPGSGRHRIAPDRTGFTNLAVAGDWTACGLDAGCVEAATRSGVLAARAIRSGTCGQTPAEEVVG